MSVNAAGQNAYFHHLNTVPIILVMSIDHNCMNILLFHCWNGTVEALCLFTGDKLILTMVKVALSLTVLPFAKL